LMILLLSSSKHTSRSTASRVRSSAASDGYKRQDKVPTSYFLGASAIIYVFDLTRPSTYKNIQMDMTILKDILPDAILKVVGNKADLVEADEIQKTTNSMATPVDVITSAKTGNNVEELFEDLAREFLT